VVPLSGHELTHWTHRLSALLLANPNANNMLVQAVSSPLPMVGQTTPDVRGNSGVSLQNASPALWQAPGARSILRLPNFYLGHLILTTHCQAI